jgi:hypothetical protein
MRTGRGIKPLAEIVSREGRVYRGQVLAGCYSTYRSYLRSLSDLGIVPVFRILWPPSLQDEGACERSDAAVKPAALQRLENGAARALGRRRT